MDVAEFETLISELESRVDRLRSLYEQYFMGIEKIIPSVPHKDVERRIQALRRDQPRNTGLRFRFQMIIQRYNTYQSYWQRICRQIEEGTYKRDILRAKKRFEDDVMTTEVAKEVAKEVVVKEAPPAPVVPAAEPGRTISGSYVLNLDEEMDFDAPPKPVMKKPALPTSAQKTAPVVPPAAPSSPGVPGKSQWRKVGDDVSPQKTAPKAIESEPKPIAPKAPPPVPPKAAPAPVAARPAPAAPAPAPIKSPPKPGEVPDERMRQIYAQYVQTKRAHNESTAQVTFENLAKTIRDSTAKLKEKHAGKSIDFEVAVKDGKTVLKPVVK